MNKRNKIILGVVTAVVVGFLAWKFLLPMLKVSGIPRAEYSGHPSTTAVSAASQPNGRPLPVSPGAAAGKFFGGGIGRIGV